MEQQNRQSQPRGRGRGRGTRRNFGSDSVERTEQGKLAAKTEQIQDRAVQQPKVVDNQKKESLIEKGKAWLNKHFNGMTKSERGNIKVTLNSRADYEIYALYESRLKNIISSQFIYDEKTKIRAQHFLKPFISTLIGIKLLKANTQFGKANMIQYRGISDIDIRGPGNLLALVDNFGKSDAINDNVIRIRAQNSFIKQRFFDAIVDFCGYDAKFEDENFQFANGIKFANLNNYRTNHIVKESNLRLFDISVSGIELINSLGEEAINFLNKKNFEVPIGDGDPAILRLPYFDPKWMKDLDRILEWEEKVRKFFTLVKYDYKSYVTTIGMALVGWLPLRFIQDVTKKMGDIDDRFKHTVFENAIPEKFLLELELYPMSLLMSESQLIDNTITLLGYYKEKYEKVYDLAFNMKEFRPTEYGSSAQVVENHEMSSRYLEDPDLYGDKISVVSQRVRTQSRIKMRDDEALLGSIFRFNRKIDMVNNYDINLANTTQQIKLDYVMKDFKV